MNKKERLQKIINELKITPAELARRINTSKGAISDYINPKSDRQPGTAIALKIEKTFGVSSDWLLTGEGSMFLPPPPVTAIPDRENLTVIIDELKKLSPEDTEGIKRLCCNLLNITPSEFDELKTVISSDKPKIFVYLQALTGDPSAKKMIRQLLDND